MQVQLPYLAEENHDEDPEVQVKPESDTAAARTVKEAIYNNKAKEHNLQTPAGCFFADCHIV
jgi:hypothetical protein